MTGAGDPSGRALAELLLQARLTTSDELPEIIVAAARHLGARDVVLRIVDHAQVALVPFGSDGPPLPIEGTVEGCAYERIRAITVPDGDDDRVHAPLVDSVERLGVLSATLPRERDAEALAAFCALVAYLLRIKQATSDVLQRRARLSEMSLAGEVQWALLPPLTIATRRVVIASMLEPAYDVGGDVIDYSIESGDAHFAIFDAMGHSLGATVLVSVAVGAYRNARRAEVPLEEVAERLDAALEDQFGSGRLVTAVLAHLDLATGRLRWVNGGHPPPVLLRGARLVGELAGTPEPPFGVGLRTSTTVHEAQLEPGDRVLAFTDGVLEARGADGSPFGLHRLLEVIEEGERKRLPVPETMRRISRAVVTHAGERLRDDATHLVVEWRSDEADRLVP